MSALQMIKESLLHFFFPHVCAGCGNDVLNDKNELCLRCAESLPETHFELYRDNPVEKKFWGRLQLQNATAQYYFVRESLTQHLIHQFKYKGNRELGLQLGSIMGYALDRSDRFSVDALVPLPLFPHKEKRRGFNQSEILCRGIAEYLHVPVLTDVIIRPTHTETQTHKGRIERWKNMEGKFVVTNPGAIEGKHLLLVDDVITTGATLESCGAELLKAANTQLSITCLCYAAR
jgi:ComF family protein